MKMRRFLTIAGIGLAVIRPAGADEPAATPVGPRSAPGRVADPVITVRVEDGPARRQGGAPAVFDRAITRSGGQVVTDFPPRKLAPQPGEGQMPTVGNPAAAPQVPAAPTSPQAPGVIPGVPEPPPTPPGDVPPIPPTEEPDVPPPAIPPVEEPVPPTPVPPPVEEPVFPTPPEPPAETDVPEPVFPPGTTPEPPVPGEVGEVTPPVGPEETTAPPAFEPTPADAFAGAGDVGAGAMTDFASTEAMAATGGFPTPEVFGDALGGGGIQLFQRAPQPPPPLPRPPVPPRPPSPFQPVESAALVPTIRAIKLSENQSPAPRSRLIYQFNFYDDVNGAVNDRFGSPISDIGIYRHIFGFERAFADQMASIGMRFPLDTVTADSPLPNVGRTSTAVGNLEIFGKFVLYRDAELGRLLSAGLSVSPNTGPNRFAGADYLLPRNNTTIQPFVGGIFTSGRFFAQGFFSIQVPFDTNDVTILYNDYAFGYFLYRSHDPNQLLSAVIPTFEVHVNTPLNHRGVRIDDPAGTPDFVNLTYGTAFDFGRRARFLAALVTPVTGPRPFDLEVIASLNIYY